MACTSVFSGGRPIHFVILHTNDLHGHILPYAVKDKKGATIQVGGYDRLGYLVEKIRRNNPVLLLDAGDISQGTPVSNLFFGEPMAQSMDILHYDAAVVGNHEFDWGLKHLETFIGWCRFPVLAANVMETLPGDRVEELPRTRPYVMETIDGVKIGIVGIVTPTTPSISKPSNMKDLIFLQPAPVIKKWIPVLRRKGARIIIALTHLGVDDDVALAKAVPSIDLIVGGHSHTVLEQAVVVGHTTIVQTGSYCRNLGDIDVTMSGGRPRFDYHLIPIYPDSIPSEPRIAAVMERYRRKVAPLMSRVIGKLNVDLTRNRTGESTLGDVISDALRRATGADVAFQNSGGIRADLYSGTVKWSDVFTVLPFDDAIVTMNLKGKDILDIINQSVSGTKGLIQVSGLKYTFHETTNPDGTVLRAVTGVWIGGKKVDPYATYHVVTSDFLSTGGDGFAAFERGTRVVHGKPLLDAVIDYLKARSPFSFAPDGRISNN